MQFLAALIVGVIAIFMAAFFIPQIQDTLNLTISQNAQQQASVGEVLGASTQKVLQVSDTLATMHALPHTSQFAALFDVTHMSSQLIATGTYTFFVPTDDVLFPALLANMTIEEKQRFLAYHIVPGRKLQIGDPHAGNVTTLSRDLLNLNVFEDVAAFGGNRHVIATYDQGNIIMYVIDGVLLPPVRRPFPF